MKAIRIVVWIFSVAMSWLDERRVAESGTTAAEVQLREGSAKCALALIVSFVLVFVTREVIHFLPQRVERILNDLWIVKLGGVVLVVSGVSFTVHSEVLSSEAAVTIGMGCGVFIASVLSRKFPPTIG